MKRIEFKDFQKANPMFQTRDKSLHNKKETLRNLDRMIGKHIYIIFALYSFYLLLILCSGDHSLIDISF